MKKLTPRFQRWLKMRALREEEKKSRTRIYVRDWSDYRPRGDARAKQFVQDLTPNERAEILTPKILKDGIRVEMPEILCLDENFKETCEFFEDFRFYLKKKSVSKIRKTESKKSAIETFAKGRQYFDFRCIKKITTSAALVLAAEFDRLSRLTNIPLFPIQIEEWNDSVRDTLEEIGFLEILNAVNEIRPVPEDREIFIHKFISGTNVELESGDTLISELNNRADAMTEPAELQLLSAVGEAMTNAIGHAYPVGHRYLYPVTKRWWMTGGADPGKSRIKVIVYDQGITIPVHLQKMRRNRITDLLSTGIELDKSDGRLIQRATKLGRTGTGESKHGKGFEDMKSAIDVSGAGRLRVLSRSGEYIYQTGCDEKWYNHPSSIGGTLIEWEIAAR